MLPNYVNPEFLWILSILSILSFRMLFQMANGKRKSFGIKITKERLALLKETIGNAGNLILEVAPGETKVVITIPLKEF